MEKGGEEGRGRKRWSGDRGVGGGDVVKGKRKSGDECGK